MKMKHESTFTMVAMICAALVHGFVPALHVGFWGNGRLSTRHERQLSRPGTSISSLPIAERLGRARTRDMHMLPDQSGTSSKLEAFNSWLREKEILRDRLGHGLGCLGESSATETVSTAFQVHLLTV